MKDVVLDEMYNQLNGCSKHDAVVIGRRIRAKENQRLEAKCCPDCGLPIEYIYQPSSWFKTIYPCGHNFLGNRQVIRIFNERNLDGIQ